MFENPITHPPFPLATERSLEIPCWNRLPIWQPPICEAHEAFPCLQGVSPLHLRLH